MSVLQLILYPVEGDEYEEPADLDEMEPWIAAVILFIIAAYVGQSMGTVMPF